MKKIILAFLLCTLYFVPCTCFSQANTYFHDRIDTTIFGVADTAGHGANNYYATNLSLDFNIKQYVNGCAVNLFIKKGNTGSSTITLITKTGTLSTKTVRKANGQLLVSGDIKDSTCVLFTFYNGSWRYGDVPASSTSWLLIGNSGTIAGTNFIGTTDSMDFVFKVNNRERGRINRNGGSWTLGATGITHGKLIMKGLTSGSVTVTPAAAAGSWTLTLPIDDGTASQFLQTDGTGITSWQTVTPATIGAWSTTGNAGTTAGTNFLGTTDAQDVVFKRNSSEVMRLYSSNNNVGIGTATPSSKLFIEGHGTDGVIIESDAVASFLTLRSVSSPTGFTFTNVYNGDFLEIHNGNVGGTTIAELTHQGMFVLGANGFVPSQVNQRKFYVYGSMGIETSFTTVSGSTSGRCYFEQIQDGATYKKVLVNVDTLLGTASFTFPVPFIKIPAILKTSDGSEALVTSLSTTAVTVTGASEKTWIILEGYFWDSEIYEQEYFNK